MNNTIYIKIGDYVECSVEPFDGAIGPIDMSFSTYGQRLMPMEYLENVVTSRLSSRYKRLDKPQAEMIEVAREIKKSICDVATSRAILNEPCYKRSNHSVYEHYAIANVRDWIGRVEALIYQRIEEDKSGRLKEMVEESDEAFYQRYKEIHIQKRQALEEAEKKRMEEEIKRKNEEVLNEEVRFVAEKIYQTIVTREMSNKYNLHVSEESKTNPVANLLTRAFACIHWSDNVGEAREAYEPLMKLAELLHEASRDAKVMEEAFDAFNPAVLNTFTRGDSEYGEDNGCLFNVETGKFDIEVEDMDDHEAGLFNECLYNTYRDVRWSNPKSDDFNVEKAKNLFLQEHKTRYMVVQTATNLLSLANRSETCLKARSTLHTMFLHGLDDLHLEGLAEAIITYDGVLWPETVSSMERAIKENRTRSCVLHVLGVILLSEANMRTLYKEGSIDYFLEHLESEGHRILMSRLHQEVCNIFNEEA
jgi:hypothetical protein